MQQLELLLSSVCLLTPQEAAEHTQDYLRGPKAW